MTIKEYHEVLDYLKRLIEGSEFEGHVYSVGGCERDAFLGKEIKDIDLVVDVAEGGIRLANYLQQESFVHEPIVTYPNFGTAMFRLNKFPGLELEAVHTRSECYREKDSRNPETSFGTIKEDCKRRDFTYNAIYHNISKDETCFFNSRSERDIKENILRTCGAPDIIFEEDPLRILRAIRFACRYNSIIEPNTFDGMKYYVKRLEILSKERIQDELVKIVTGNNLDLAVNYIFRVGAMPYIFPNFSHQINAEQILLRSIKIADTHDLIVNLAAFMDLSENAKEDLKQLKFSNDVIDECLDILDMNINEIIFEKETLLDSDIRKFQYKCGTYSNMVKHLNYMRATYERYNIDDITYEVKQLTDDMVRRGTDMFGYKLPLDGNDVMEVKQIAPCAAVKRYLDMLLNYAYLNPGITKDECITLLKYN